MAALKGSSHHICRPEQILRIFVISFLLLESVADECQGNDSRCEGAGESKCKALQRSGTHCKWVDIRICASWCAGHDSEWEAKCNFDRCRECNPCAALAATSTSTILTTSDTPPNTDGDKSFTVASNVDGDDNDDASMETFASASQSNVMASSAGVTASKADVPVLPIAIGAGSVVVFCVAVAMGRQCYMHGSRSTSKERAHVDLEANNEPNTNFTLEVEDEARGNAVALGIPPCWVNQTGEFCSRTDVSDETLQAMQKLLDSTFKKVKSCDRKDGVLPSKLVLVSAQRMEHSALWRNYSKAYSVLRSKRQTCTPLEKSRGGNVKTSSRECPESSLLGSLDDKANEVFLWHGTKSKAAEAILRDGFSLDMGQAHGTLYGKGVYLAECSSKSDEYAVESCDGSFKGVHCVLLCRAILGEALTLTKGGDQASAGIAALMESGTYDSVLGDREVTSSTYREFVVYDESRVYPEYVVFYKRQI